MQHKVLGYHGYMCMGGTEMDWLAHSHLSPPHPLSLEAFYSSISLALKWNHLIPLCSHPTVTAFVLRADANETGLFEPRWRIGSRLVFLSGPEMWMFTVGRGLITFLQQLKSIGPLMGPIKQWEKPIVTMDLIVSEWTHLALCGECGVLKKKQWRRERVRK